MVDRYRRRKSVDVVHVGLVHLPQELARVGRKRLDVSALAFGVDGIEGEGRLAAPGDAGDDHELVAGNLDRDIFEVILPRADNNNLILSHETKW